MDVNTVLQMSMAAISHFCEAQDHRTLQEFEVLAYEQACRTYETLMRDFRTTWEGQKDGLRENQE